MYDAPQISLCDQRQSSHFSDSHIFLNNDRNSIEKNIQCENNIRPQTNKQMNKERRKEACDTLHHLFCVNGLMFV